MDLEKLNEKDFDADKYVGELSKKFVGGEELLQQRKAVQALSESTSMHLKKNVYHNYTQFIETGREMSHLESEMYQLSHLLAEQTSLLNLIYTSNPTAISDRPQQKKKGVDEREAVAAVVEKVEGSSALLDVKDRRLLHEGDLIECDPADNSGKQSVRAYLLNDTLLLASNLNHRRGPARYKIYKLLELSSLAVVNVRDLAPVKYAFKILAFPDSMLFICHNANSKKEWLEKFDLAKKEKIASEKSVQPQVSVESGPRLDRLLSQSQSSVDEPSVVPLPDWFLESPEDLDVFIAERHFEEALDLLSRAKAFADALPNNSDPFFLDVVKKMESRRKNLIEVLVKELDVSPEKSLQGGLRGGARRAVKLLIALGRHTQACDLLLELCSSLMRKELKSVRREGSSHVYVERLGHQLYSRILEVASEVTKQFGEEQTAIAALVVWTHGQLVTFLAHVIKQVFVPQVPLSTVSDCVATLRAQNEQLSDCGMDLRYHMEGMLQKPVTGALADAKEKAVEGLRHRAAQDNWRPLNLNSNAARAKLIQELEELGMHVSNTFLRGESWLELTGNTLWAVRLVRGLAEDCCKLYSSHLHHQIEDLLYEVLRSQLRFIDSALNSHAQDAQVSVIEKNAVFVLDEVIPVVGRMFHKAATTPSAKLSALSAEYGHLKTRGTRPKPAPRHATLPKYHSDQML